ncbi:MAG: cupredoxin domain-containing protein [Rhodanobacter sp.]|nr:MAG: cupredoxin domain-containing protein [Rhodanobacter sp.]
MKGCGTSKIGALVVIVAAAGLPAAWAQAPGVSSMLTIRGQAFQPRTLTIPAGQQVKIVVKNDDALPAEFESGDLNQEKVIPGGTALPVYIRPLKPGTYKFFNDFHPASTGTLVVEQPKR